MPLLEFASLQLYLMEGVTLTSLMMMSLMIGKKKKKQKRKQLQRVGVVHVGVVVRAGQKSDSLGLMRMVQKLKMMIHLMCTSHRYDKEREREREVYWLVA